MCFTDYVNFVDGNDTVFCLGALVKHHPTRLIWNNPIGLSSVMMQKNQSNSPYLKSVMKIMIYGVGWL